MGAACIHLLLLFGVLIGFTITRRFRAVYWWPILTAFPAAILIHRLLSHEPHVTPDSADKRHFYRCLIGPPGGGFPGPLRAHQVAHCGVSIAGLAIALLLGVTSMLAP